jgi:predicted DNA-binding transcriptional regulator YafY
LCITPRTAERVDHRGRGESLAVAVRGDRLVLGLMAGTEKGRRTFRVDRIGAAAPTDLVAERPAGFDPARAWAQVAGEVEQRRSLISATVLIPERFLPVLRDQFGRHCEPLETLADGRVRARIAAHMALSIAETVAGWGDTVEVLEPESVRAELARLGTELVQRYGRAAG